MKAQGFLGTTDVLVKESVNAAKVRFEGAVALEVLTCIRTLIVAKGKRVEHFELGENRPSDEELLPHLLGPTGNLRAPTLRIGNTLIVGFNEDVYQEFLG